MKRIISLLLVFCMLLSVLPMTVLAAEVNRGISANTANLFKDVKETDWFYDAVQYARINGFFNGISNTEFDPHGTMTRGMFITVLGRMAGVDAEDYTSPVRVFKDVSVSKYYAPYVAWAEKYGITTGTGEGNFSPDALINRQQMATFFVRYFEAFDVDYSIDANVASIPADMDLVESWAEDAVLKLWTEGLLNGDGTNFNPDDSATRAQMATVAMRADEAVDVWYKEPGVPSDRVRIDPATGLPYETEDDIRDNEDDEKQDDDESDDTTDREGITIPVWNMYRTVTYTDGVPDEEVFADQSYSKLIGFSTPEFEGTPEREGYIFIGWNPEVAKTVTASVTYTAQWEALPTLYTITYTDGVDDEVVFADQSYTVEEGSETPEFDGTPSRDGYTFEGWNPDVADNVTGNVTYTAQWEAIIVIPDPVYYTVTYTDGVDDEVVFADQSYTVEEGSETPEFDGTPSRDGYTFEGWNPDVADNVTGNVTYTAQWEALPTIYTVSYTDGVDDEVVFDDQTYSVEEGSETPEFEGTPSREGYIFIGWNPEVAEIVTGSVTYTAQWEAAEAEVTFHISEETTETRSAQIGTLIEDLPVPYVPQKLFLGWYYDSALTEMVESTDTVTDDLHLYAKYIDQELSDTGSPNFVSAEDQASDFSVQIINVNGDEITEDDYRLHNVTDSSYTDGTLGVEQDVLVLNDSTLSALDGFREGHTYKIELLNDDVVFVVDGTAQNPAVRFFNFNIYKEEVMSLELSDGIYYIDADDTSDALSDEDAEKILDGSGLVQMNLGESGQATYNEVTNNGTFTFTEGEFEVGDLVSVYRGTRPDLRDTTVGEDDAAYVEIIAVSGDLYTYQAADVTDVLLLPDVLPLPADLFTDGNSAELPKTALDFSIYSEMGYDSSTKVNVGDFLALFDGDSVFTCTEVSYVRVCSVEDNGDTITVTYEAATEDDIYASADMYLKRPLTDEEIDAAMADEQLMEQIILNQLNENNFGSEMSDYLISLVLQTEEVKEYFGEELTLSDVIISTVDRSKDTDGIQLMGQLVGIGGDGKPELKTNVTKKLSHFEDQKGARAEVIMTYEFEIRKADSDKQLNVELEAFFEQEVLFDLVAHGEATWGKFWKIPYLQEYRIGGSLDLGTYTGIGISAVASLAEKEEAWGMPWPKNNAQAAAARNIVDLSQSIKKLMDAKEALTAGNDVGAGEGLQETYKSFLEDANEAWIDIFEVKLFETEIMLDPTHICVLGIEANFIVSANLNVGLGMTMSYENSKRFTFDIKVLSLDANFDAVDLSAEAFTFDCYVMGTMGIRAGVRLSLTIGIVTTKLAEAGVSLELGVYSQLWGYFYYSYSWEEDDGKSSEYSGAIYAELGAYLTIGIEASAVAGLLSFELDIIDLSVPLIHIGWAENVYDFAYKEDETPVCDFVGSATFTLPDTIYEMKYMDMTSGKDKQQSFDTKYNLFDWISDKIYGEPTGDAADDEEYFVIELSNPLFSYDPKKNQITIDATATGELEQSSEMRITWIRSPLTFSSETLSRTITINWSNPGSYVSFDSLGGEVYAPIIKVAGTNISALKPTANPVREGYTFKGWCSNQAEGHEHDDYTECTLTDIPDVMPENPLVLSACWEPNDAVYTVEHYFEGLDGKYVLADTQTFIGKTRDVVSIEAGTFEGFTVRKDSTSKSLEILPGSDAVCKLYYTRNSYTLTFDRGTVGGEGVEFTVKYGAPISVPDFKEPGYTLIGFADLPETMPAADSTYVAQWSANLYTITFDSDGGSEVEPITQPYKSEVTAPEAPTKDGYVFDTWLYNGTPYTFTTMPLGGIHLVAKWSGAQNYAVEYYLQNADGTYTLAERDTSRSANTGDTVTAQDYDLTKYGNSDGYHLDVNADGSVLSAVVGEQPTVIKIYFARDTYTLSYTYSTGGYWSNLEDQTPPEAETHRWGEVISLHIPEDSGKYSVNSWQVKQEDGTAVTLDGGNTFVMPQSNVTATATWAYTVINTYYHYTILENGVPTEKLNTSSYSKYIGLGTELKNKVRIGADVSNLVYGTDASGNTVCYLHTGWVDSEGNPASTYIADYQEKHFYATLELLEGYVGIRVGGTPITPQNSNDVLGDGTVSYDPDTATLTLKNAALSGYQDNLSTYSYTLVFDAVAPDAVTIMLQGKNSITGITDDSTPNYMCIYDARGRDATINIVGTDKQTDSLKVAFVEHRLGAYSTFVKTSKKVLLNVENCTVDSNMNIEVLNGATVQSSVLNLESMLRSDYGLTLIKDSTVKIRSTSENNDASISANNLTIDNSVVDINVDSRFESIDCKNDILISNGSKVNVTATYSDENPGWDHFYHSVYCNKLTVTGEGTTFDVVATQPGDVDQYNVAAIKVGEKLEVLDGATVIARSALTDHTDSSGLRVGNCAITVDNATLEVYGLTAAIRLEKWCKVSTTFNNVECYEGDDDSNLIKVDVSNIDEDTFGLKKVLIIRPAN